MGTDKDGNDTVTIQVGKAYLQDMNKCNLSNYGGIINLGNQEFYYESWSYNVELDENGKEVYSYTFTLSGEDKNPRRVTNDREGKAASIGASINYQGVPYYMSQMNEWVRTFAQKFNDIVTSGYDSNGEQGIKMFTGNLATDDDQYEFPDGNRYDLFLQGHKLLQEAYAQAPETMVLEAAAKSIYEAAIADPAFQTAVDAAKQTKVTAKTEAKLKEKIDLAMSAPAVQEEIKTRAAALRAADTSLSQADAEKKAREEIENEFRNGTGTPPKTKVELTQDEKDKIEEAADKEAKAEVEAKYKADALAQAEKDLKDKGEWDAAVEKAKEEILKGTDEGKAALDQVKAEIAKKNGVSVKALDMVEKLVNARRDEIRAENAAANPPIHSCRHGAGSQPPCQQV